MSAVAQLESSYPLVLTTRQVCEILQIDRHTLYKAIEAGTLAPIRLAGLRVHRFSRDAVLKIIRSA